MAQDRRDLAGVVTERRKDRKLRFVRVVIVVSSSVLVLPLVMSAVVDLLMGPAERRGLGLLYLAAALLASFLLLWMLFGRVRLGQPRRVSPWAYWGASALAAAVALGALTPIFGMLLLGGWVGVTVFLGPRSWGWWLLAGAVALFAALTVQAVELDVPLAGVVVLWVVLVLWSLFMAGAVLIYVRLWDVTNEALLEQRARARLAVSEERLRFSRDMHDLLGHSLSALVVKSELAERVLERDPARAAEEMTEVQGLARRSLSQVRAAVRGYREIDLHAEVEAVRTALAANGIRTEVSGVPENGVPTGTAATAAWVVREGVTNVLRHSEATECRITFTRAGGDTGDALVVEVGNDRARGRARDGGSGLTGLSERLAGTGGRLTAEPTPDGGFLLRATVPWSIEGADRPAGNEEARP
ncbi:sensor histidine kinase [Nocardiopsis sp. HNM0947]|uniref:Sensor histidine kinase n=1 Tax=Nocardiopsis coralli TaxID=2772213 RepID=A0ABR9P4S7_9ACTN|nr:sensor histidine kinase [Nocardiopsis coralli]MBE2998848.1 sensor histidine kinase [Nocardiopsis coralli]